MTTTIRPQGTPRQKSARFICSAAVLALAVSPVSASSHREAPFITENPKVDGTDFYMFNGYEPGRANFVTIVANYLPLQDPYGGPNYFSLDPQAVYDINIDNNGDGIEDITFRFRMLLELRDLTVPVGGVDVSVPLINIGGIGPGAGDTGPLNVLERYTVEIIRTGSGAPIRDVATGSTTFIKPVDNIGNKSIADYEAYADDHIYDILIPGCPTPGRMFVGQRKDPFVVNLGETFDLVNLNPLGDVDGEEDSLADKNVTSLILEVPSSCLTAGDDPVIGGWTTASLPRARILTPNPTFDKPATEQGTFVQVSRLGMPLVNEVVIGLKDKNRFNASRPQDDSQFGIYVTNPTLPVLLQVLFGVTPPCLPRNDLVAVFLTGIPGLTQPAAPRGAAPVSPVQVTQGPPMQRYDDITGGNGEADDSAQPRSVVPSEMLRLNTNVDSASGGIPPTPKGSQSNLGVIGGDLAGFPNGRRPGDDVVDIALRVVMGVLYTDAGDPDGCAPHGNLPFTDGAYVDDSMFDGEFPYLTTPIPGSPN